MAISSVAYYIAVTAPVQFDDGAELGIDVTTAFCAAYNLSEGDLGEIGISLPAIVRVIFLATTASSPSASTHDASNVGELPRSTSEVSYSAECSIRVSQYSAILTSVQPISAFTLCWWALGLLMRSIRIVCNAPIAAISFHTQDPMVSYQYTDGEIDEGDEGHVRDGMFVLPERFAVRTPRDFTIPNECLPTIAIVGSQLANGEPSYLILNQVSEAKTKRYIIGDESGALLHVAVACEIALDQLLLALLWEEGASSDNVVELWNGSGLQSRVSRHFASRLGGKWAKGQGGAVDAWRTSVALLRGRLVHAGREPTKAQVDGAFAAMHDLMNFVHQRLGHSATKFPRTLLLFCSPEKASGLVAKRLIAKVAKESADADVWVLDFLAWRGEVTSQLVD